MAAAVAAGRKERGPKAAKAAASPARSRGARKTPATGQGDFQSWENSMASPVGRRRRRRIWRLRRRRRIGWETWNMEGFYSNSN